MGCTEARPVLVADANVHRNVALLDLQRQFHNYVCKQRTYERVWQMGMEQPAAVNFRLGFWNSVVVRRVILLEKETSARHEVLTLFRYCGADLAHMADYPTTLCGSDPEQGSNVPKATVGLTEAQYAFFFG